MNVLCVRRGIKILASFAIVIANTGTVRAAVAESDHIHTVSQKDSYQSVASPHLSDAHSDTPLEKSGSSQSPQNTPSSVPVIRTPEPPKHVNKPPAENLAPSPKSSINQEKPPDLPNRSMSLESYENNASHYINSLPSLQQLSVEMPELFENYKEQERYIAELDANASVTPKEYATFAIDQTYNTSFKGVGSYEQTIRPRLFIIHWTAERYNDPEHLATSMTKNGNLRIDYFTDHTSTVHQMFEDDTKRPAHAFAINDSSQGVEIEAKNLFDLTPEQIKQTVLLTVKFCRENNLPITEETVLGHYAADLIFANPYYNPESGTFTEPRLRKFDPPQELIKIIVVKAADLNAQLTK